MYPSLSLQSKEIEYSLDKVTVAAYKSVELDDLLDGADVGDSANCSTRSFLQIVVFDIF